MLELQVMNPAFEMSILSLMVGIEFSLISGFLKKKKILMWDDMAWRRRKRRVDRSLSKKRKWGSSPIREENSEEGQGSFYRPLEGRWRSVQRNLEAEEVEEEEEDEARWEY